MKTELERVINNAYATAMLRYYQKENAKLRAALEHVINNAYCGKDAEWRFRSGYDPQLVLDALTNKEAVSVGVALPSSSRTVVYKTNEEGK